MQSCPNCGCEFNYFDKTATIICDRNHVTCKSCAIHFNKTRPQCPYCFPMSAFQNQQYIYHRQQPQIINKPGYWQPNSAQNLNNNVQPLVPQQLPPQQLLPQQLPQPQNQGLQEPQLIYPLIQRSSNLNIFLGLSIFFFVVFFATFMVMVGLSYYQMASMPFVSLILAIIFLVKYKKEKKYDQEIQLTLANNHQGLYPGVQGGQGGQGGQGVHGVQVMQQSGYAMQGPVAENNYYRI